MRIQVQGIYEKKWYKNKIVITIAVLAIVIAIIAVICNYNYVIGNFEQEEENIVENIVQEEIEIVEEEKNYLPQLTEEGEENISSIYSSDIKIAYLTFDDGPSGDVTPLILDLLKQEDIKATFFVLGSKVKAYPDVVKRAYEEGHYIANHGYSHKYDKIYETAQTVLEEFTKTEQCIRDAIEVEEYSSHLFRFPGGSVGPYGAVKKEAIELLKENNIAYIDWNALTRDSEGKFTKEELLNNLKSTVKNKKSVVVLCHDASGKILTYEVLKDIINYLREEGYTFGDMRDIIK